MPAVDAGWVAVSRQVGQSGKYVTPRVYVAVGISGTPQHLAGIGPDTQIVAINNDPQADIFGVAKLGVVADWNALLPGYDFPGIPPQMQRAGKVFPVAPART